MPVTVDIPSEGVSVDFPDSMSQGDIQQVVRRKFGAKPRAGIGDAKVADIDYDRPAPPEGGPHEEDSGPGRPAMGDLRASEADQTAFKDLSADQPLTIRHFANERPSTTAGGPPISLPEGAAKSIWNQISEEMTNPRATLPRAKITERDSALATVGKEAVNIGSSLPEFFTSDAGILTAAVAPAMPVATSAYFTFDMLKSLGEQVMAAHKDWDKMSRNQKLTALTDMAGTGVMALLTGKHTTTGVLDKTVPARALAKQIRETPLTPAPESTSAALVRPGERTEMPLDRVAELIRPVAPLTAAALAEAPKVGPKAEPVTTQADLDKTVAEETVKKTEEKPAHVKTDQLNQDEQKSENLNQPDVTPPVTEQSTAGPVPLVEPPTGPAVGPADSEKPVTAKTLTPVVITGDGQKLTGPSHAEITEKYAKQGIDTITGRQEGFLDENGNFVTRAQGAKWFKEKTGEDTNVPGELHSQDLKRKELLSHLDEKPPNEAESEPTAGKPLDWDRAYKLEHGDLLDAQRRMEAAQEDGDTRLAKAAKRERDDILSRLDEFDKLSKREFSQGDPTVEALRRNPRLTFAEAVSEGVNIPLKREADKAYDAVLDAGGSQKEARAAADKVLGKTTPEPKLEEPTETTTVESYGEKYVREHGAEAAKARIAELNSRFNEELAKRNLRAAENLSDEAENIRKALPVEEPPKTEQAPKPGQTVSAARTNRVRAEKKFTNDQAASAVKDLYEGGFVDEQAELERVRARLTKPQQDKYGDALSAVERRVEKGKDVAARNERMVQSDPGLEVGNEEPVTLSKPKSPKVETPATAVEKVEGAVEDMTPRTAKQAKSELIQRLENAIEKAPSEKLDRSKIVVKAEPAKMVGKRRVFGPRKEFTLAEIDANPTMFRLGRSIEEYAVANARAAANEKFGKITIDIPGDGAFTIWNTKEALTDMIGRAKALDTSGAQKKPFTENLPSKAERQEMLKEAEVKPPTEPTHPEASDADALKASDEITSKAALELKGMGGAVAGEFAGGGTATSNKNAVVDAERAQRGLPPMMKALKHTWGQAWDEAMARIDADPEYQDKLVAELQRKPRALTYTENAALLHRRVELRNGYDKSTRDAANGYDDAEHATSDEARDSAKARMVEARSQTAYYSDKLQELENATKAAGSESGRSLAARKMMANEDYTLAKMELEARAARGGRPLTDAERAEIVELQKKIEQTQKAYDDYRAEADRKIAEAESKTTHAEQLRKAAEEKAPHPSILRVAERIVSELDSKADAARARIRARMGRTTAGVDPTVLLDVAEIGASHLAHKILDFAKWSEKMIQDVGDWVKPHLQTVWDMSQTRLDEFADSKAPKAAASDVKKILRTDPPEVQQEALTERIADKVKKGKKDEIAWYVQKLARAFIMQGIDKFEPLIDALHARLAKVLPDLTRREVQDMYTGYGDFKQLSKDAISVTDRDLKAQGQLLAKLEDLEARKPILKSGRERAVQTDEQRRLTAKVNEAKKKFGVVVTDPATQLASALTARKTYYRNRMADLKLEIETRKKIVQTKSPVPTDAALEAMKAEYERLKEQHEQIFTKPGLTDAQRVDRAIKGLEDDIKEYEKRVASKDISPMKQPSRTPSTPELEAVRARRDALRAQLDEMRELANPKLTPDQRANKALKTRLMNQIMDYADRLAREDYSRRPKQVFPLDSEATRLKAENERLKKQYQEGLIKARLAERRGAEKGFDIVSKLRRFAVLSGVKVLGKLGAYSATKMGTIGATEGVSAVISRIPKISEIAKKAPSEGGPSLRIVTRAAAKAFTSGVMDAFQTATRGKSDLREAYSARPAIPRDWLDFFQTVHEVIKSPLRRMAFEVSYAKRMAHAVEMGVVDTNDLSVQMAIGKDAYVDSDRALLLENNRLASGIRNLFRRLEDKDRGTGRVPLVGKAMATLGRVETPILTVPFNYAKQTLESAFGLVTGGIRAREAFKAGIENLSPEEADNIMRHLKYGTIGGAMLLYGFYDGWNNGDNGVFGGYYQPGQKRKETQAGVGGLKIAGHKISGLLLHNPVLAVGQLGHTIGAVAQQKFTKHDKQTKGITVGLAAGAFGLISDSPIGREAEFVEHMSDPRALPYAMGEHLKGILVPQIVQEAGEWMDRDKNGNLIKRKPKTITEHVQSGVPIWREELPKQVPVKNK